MDNIAMESVTALGIIALIIVLTDRWVARFYRAYKTHAERQELSDNQLMLVMVKCSETLVVIQESFQKLDKT